MQRAMHDTVDEVGKVSADEGIDCHFVKGGTTRFATTPAHVARMQAEVDAGARRSASPRTTSAGSTPTRRTRRIAVAGQLGAVYTPHCAAIHPARLARGLAEVVERSGSRRCTSGRPCS